MTMLHSSPISVADGLINAAIIGDHDQVQAILRMDGTCISESEMRLAARLAKEGGWDDTVQLLNRLHINAA